MKTFIILATGILLLVSCGENTLNKVSTLNIPDKYEQRVDSVLKLMTLDEKIGQLNQYTGNWQATGPVVEDPTKIEQIKAGKVGSMLNIKSVLYYEIHEDSDTIIIFDLKAFKENRRKND